MIRKSLPPLEYLRECFDLLPDGVLIWKKRPREHFKNLRGQMILNAKLAGKQAGNISVHGYRVINLRWCGKQRLYQAARIVFMMVNGYCPHEIDHKNVNSLDNSPGNLRACTHSQNGANRLRTANNKSGYKGIVFQKIAGKFSVRIQKDGVSYNGGRLYDTAEEAHARYCELARSLFGEFAMGEQLFRN